MNPKHSSAPWIETETDDGDLIVRMDKAHAVVIANLEGSCEICHGNAHLITAAPELLEALEEMLDMWKRHCTPRDIEFDSQVKQARAAIAKAKGETT